MKNVRKILAIALAGVMTASLMTACGSKTKNTSSNSGSSGKNKDTVVVWTYPHFRANKELGVKGYEDILKERIAEYKKTHPNVNVKYEILSWAEGDKKFDIALNAGTPPDIFYTTAQAKYVKTGLAIPIDKYLTDEDKNDFVPFALDRYKIDGKQYGLATWISVHCLAGNKKFFTDAGIDYKKIMEHGWTWDEFYEDTKKMTKKVNGKKVYGFVTHAKTTDEMLRHFLMSNGMGTGLSKDGEFQFKGEGVVETLNFFKKLLDEGIMPKETLGFDDQKMTDTINLGQAAAWGRVGPYAIKFSNIRNAAIDSGKEKGKKLDPILLPFPHSNKGKDCVYGDCGGYMAFRQKKEKGEEHRKNVVDLLKELTGTEADIASAGVYTTPARKSGQELIKGKLKTSDENLAFMNRAVDIVQSRPILSPEIDAKYSKVDKEAIFPLYQAFLVNEKTAKEVEEGISKKAKEVFGN